MTDWYTWTLFRVGSPLPANHPQTFHHAAEAWVEGSGTLLVVTGATAEERRRVGVWTLRSLNEAGSGFWTVADYLRDAKARDEGWKLVRSTSGAQEVINETRDFERRFLTREGAPEMLLDGLSEAAMTTMEARDVYRLIDSRMRANVRTVVTTERVSELVNQPLLAKAFSDLLGSAARVDL
jgi:hypothetical protein